VRIHSAVVSNRRPPMIADEDIPQLSLAPADVSNTDRQRGHAINALLESHAARAGLLHDAHRIFRQVGSGDSGGFFPIGRAARSRAASYDRLSTRTRASIASTELRPASASVGRSARLVFGTGSSPEPQVLLAASRSP